MALEEDECHILVINFHVTCLGQGTWTCSAFRELISAPNRVDHLTPPSSKKPGIQQTPNEAKADQ